MYCLNDIIFVFITVLHPDMYAEYSTTYMNKRFCATCAKARWSESNRIHRILWPFLRMCIVIALYCTFYTLSRYCAKLSGTSENLYDDNFTRDSSSDRRTQPQQQRSRGSETCYLISRRTLYAILWSCNSVCDGRTSLQQHHAVHRTDGTLIRSCSIFYSIYTLDSVQPCRADLAT